MIKERTVLKVLSPYQGLLSGKNTTDCITGEALSFHGNQGKKKQKQKHNNAFKMLLIKLANGRIIEA